MSRSASRTRRSAEEWRSLVLQQARSGLSQAEFCRREGIALATFTERKRRVLSPGERSAGFVDVTPQPLSSAGWEMELELPHGVVLRFRG